MSPKPAVIPCPAVWVGMVNPDTSDVFGGWFNKTAATCAHSMYCHTVLAWKIDETNEYGYTSSIVWGGTAFCEPERFTVQTDAGTNKLYTELSTTGRVDMYPIPLALDWDVARLLDHANKLVGLGYDKRGAILGNVGPTFLAKHSSIEARHATFCSEMVVHLLQAACDKDPPVRAAAMSLGDIVKWVDSMSP